MISETSTNKKAQHEKHKTLMNWSLKALDQSPKEKTINIGVCLTGPALNIVFVLWAFYTGDEDDQALGLWLIPGMLLLSWAFIAMILQKTLFNYRVYPDHIESDDCLYYPDYTEDLFKGIVLVGTGGALMSWQRPEPRHHPGLPWDEFHFVTVDRKYRIIVHHCTDVPQGFDVRFPDDDLLEQYLAFLHTVLRPTVKYTERVWQGNYE
ncbi:hypothetical protein ASF84_26025 [Pseudomonas sp. Leaf127]|uniref:hypothetical protein n=1 Tax=Pseudomonas sp. Leaf127 TaxID=1736267 RepID=UPI00070278C2|nr:hypothetical protein [Pseudomonas sp. Leaf127]KQQ64401.1 hypothetical protein ASF84_26025 [Pseudomonas sp. Leaf127]